VDDSGDAGTARRRHVIIRNRRGDHFRVPIAKLTEYSVPEGTVVVEWRPGRYLLFPPEALEEYRLTDEELIPLALQVGLGGGGGRRAVRRSRVAGRRLGLRG